MSPTPQETPSLVHDALHLACRQPLEAFFSPRRVALIGASERLGSVGYALLENLRLFEGRVYPVNAKHRRVSGLEAFPQLADVPEKVDLAVIATPASTVPGLIQECAAAGIKAAIIISAGFKECGTEGADLEQRCLGEARRAKMRLLGPNCLGLMAPHSRLNATFAEGMAAPGSVGFLSQSGALCSAVLDWSFRENVGFSAFVSLGSMLDVGWGDLITHLGDDPNTKSILCYMESVGDARSFLSAAREVALTKPIIVLKVGRTSAAAKAAASHTGALTGSDDVLDAAFRRAGVLRVNTIGELFNTAELLGKQPRPRGPRLSIVTNAGGPGALATDALVASGAQLAELQPSTLDQLNDLLPPHWSHGNPIDVLGDADAKRYAKAIELAAQDTQSDGVLVILTPQSMTDSKGTADQIRSIAKQTAKPLLASWMGGAGVDAGKGILNAAGIPTFDYPDTAARAFGLMWRYTENLRVLYETPAPDSELQASGCDDGMALLQQGAESSRVDFRVQKASALIASVRHDGRVLLTEIESKQLLNLYGIPTVETLLALNEDDSVRQAEGLGYPVVLKLFSKTLTHKTDVGGVRLGLTNADEVRLAWNQIRASVREKAGDQHFGGVTVQPMIRNEGYELILGSSVDPQFGPVLLFGAGGQLVEVFQDRALGLPPLNATLARSLMAQTKIFAALKGVRGRAAVDLAGLDRLLVQFSQLVAEQSWIAEVDINPLRVDTGLMMALDARVLLHPASKTEDEIPRIAIRPYPIQHIMEWTLRDGTPVTVRPIRPEDEPAMSLFHQTLSEQSVYLRYFAPLKLDQRVAHERLSRVCFIDYDREMVLVAERRNPTAAGIEILGVGRLSKIHGTRDAEFALTISDPWQGKGLGSKLLELLVQVGRAERLERITAAMLSDNSQMHRIARKVGFRVERDFSETTYRAELVLGGESMAGTASVKGA